MKKKKGNSITFILILVLLAGLSLLLYPSVSDYWNSFHQTQAIASYAENVATLEQASYDVLWEDAKAYNASLLGRSNAYLLSEAQRAQYEELLDVSGLGVMGYIEIPSIGALCPFITARRNPSSRSPWAIWIGRACPWAAQALTAFCPGTGGSPAQSCSPTWISSWKGTCSCSVSWMRC